jgi:hypothetical protein
LRAVLFLRAVPFFAVLFFAVVFRAVLFLRAVLFFAVLFFAVVFRAVLFFAAVFFTAVLRAAVLRAVLFFAVVFLAVVFLAVVFRAVIFFAAVLRAATFFRGAAFLRGAAFFFEDDERFFAELVELRPELREPERDEDRVVAGMAGATSLRSVLDASPMAESPDVMLDEPALDKSSAAPVPLQSSSVIKRPPGSVARARFPTTLLCTVQRGQHESCARCCKGKRPYQSHGPRNARTLRELNANSTKETLDQARALSNGCDVGASTPPARSSVTATVAPAGTRVVNVIRCPVNVPARCTFFDSITHAS